MVLYCSAETSSNFNHSGECNLADVSLQPYEQYINLLNDSEYSAALINREGTITSPDVKGVFVKKKNGKLGIMLGQEFNPIVYRGQCNDYPFMPSSERYELFDGNERIRHSVEWIKKNEFVQLISKSPYYTRTSEFEVLNCKYEYDMAAIAKQYNMVSENIDVTKNLMVAYFFAYTYVDDKTGERRPLEGFEYNTPMLYTGSIRNLYYRAYETVENLSFQAITSAKAQQTLSLKVGKNYDYVKSLFVKTELPKNTEIAKNVYEQFEGGRRLLPPDYASKYAKHIEGLRTLDDNLVSVYCKLTETDEVWLRGEFKKLGFDLTDKSYGVSVEAEAAINNEIDNYIIPYLDNKFIFRGIRQVC